MDRTLSSGTLGHGAGARWQQQACRRETCDHCNQDACAACLSLQRHDKTRTEITWRQPLGRVAQGQRRWPQREDRGKTRHTHTLTFAPLCAPEPFSVLSPASSGSASCFTFPSRRSPPYPSPYRPPCMCSSSGRTARAARCPTVTPDARQSPICIRTRHCGEAPVPPVNQRRGRGYGSDGAMRGPAGRGRYCVAFPGGRMDGLPRGALHWGLRRWSWARSLAALASPALCSRQSLPVGTPLGVVHMCCCASLGRRGASRCALRTTRGLPRPCRWVEGYMAQRGGRPSRL